VYLTALFPASVFRLLWPSLEVHMRAHHALVVSMSILVSMRASPVAGQHVLDTPQLAAALSREVNRANARRAAIRDALSQPRARRIASALQLDRREVDAAVEALAGPDLEKAAGVADEINRQAVSGPSSITVSTTTIVVVLLLLILVVVTLK
jgi:hypothetical protein